MLFRSKEYTPLKLGGVVKKNKEKFIDEISTLVEKDIINGKTLKEQDVYKRQEEAWELSNKAVAEALDGLPPVKMHCSVLAEEAIHKAINDYRQRQGLEPWDMKEHSHDIHEHVHG